MAETDKMKIERQGKIMQDFINSPAWTELMLPWIEKKIKESDSIRSLKIEKPEEAYAAVKAAEVKTQVYKGLKSMPNTFINKLKEQEANNG